MHKLLLIYLVQLQFFLHQPSASRQKRDSRYHSKTGERRGEGCLNTPLSAHNYISNDQWSWIYYWKKKNSRLTDSAPSVTSVTLETEWETRNQQNKGVKHGNRTTLYTGSISPFCVIVCIVGNWTWQFSECRLAGKNIVICDRCLLTWPFYCHRWVVYLWLFFT